MVSSGVTALVRILDFTVLIITGNTNNIIVYILFLFRKQSSVQKQALSWRHLHSTLALHLVNNIIYVLIFFIVITIHVHGHL